MLGRRLKSPLGSSLEIIHGGKVVLGRILKCPLCCSLKIIQGGRVVLGQVGAYIIISVVVDKTRALECPSSWSW